MKKNKKWTVLALICLLMLMVLPVKAETTGSIAIQLHSDAAEVEMTLYKVAAYADEEFRSKKRFTDYRDTGKICGSTETEGHTENKKSK